MTGLALRYWEFSEFLETIAAKADEDYDEPDEDFMEWLSGKSSEWLQELYFKLIDEKDIEDELYQLSTARIVKLSDGTFSSANKCYFPDEDGRFANIVPCVDAAIFEVGGSSIRKKGARKFLDEIGVRQVGERQLVEALLENEYTQENRPLRERDYLNHLKRFMKLAKDDSYAAFALKNYKILMGDDGKWHSASEIYLDSPFVETGLASYYSVVGKPSGMAALADFYVGLPIDTTIFAKFVEQLGATKHLIFKTVRCQDNPDWSTLRLAGGERNTSPINEDFRLDHWDSLQSAQSVELSKLIWSTMCERCPENSSRYLKARYRRNASWGSKEAPSQLVHQLRNGAWVPQGREFVRPASARAELLPDGFTFGAGWAWIKAIEFGKDAEIQSEKAKAAAAEAVALRNRRNAAAAELGFEPDDLSWLEKFRNIPVEQRERFLHDWEVSLQVIDLPDHEPRNPERRAERVAAVASDAVERRTEERTRSVSVGREDVKAEAAQYLRQQYSSDGNVICQVCKHAMPFKLDDGSAYFEKVEFLPELKRRHHQNYLALCPNHAAMFRHANGSSEYMLDMFVELIGNELEIVLAQENDTVYFTKTHIADLKKVIEVDRVELEAAEEQQAAGGLG